MKNAAMRWLRVSAVLTLVGLALMIWSILDPRPTPVMTAMTVGQGVGTAAFIIYLVVVLADLRRARVLADEAPAAAEAETKAEAEAEAEAGSDSDSDSESDSDSDAASEDEDEDEEGKA